MAQKIYNQRNYTFTVNGETFTFYCNTTHTRNGFCHHAYLCGLGRDWEHTRVSYYNRTWERFDYESCMLRACDKLPKALQPAVKAEINTFGMRECEKAQAWIKKFENNFAALSDEQKAIIKKAGTIETKEQADAVAGFTALFAALNAIRA